MKFAVVTSDDDDDMSPFIFPHGFKFNIKAYIKCLEEVVLDREGDCWKTLHLATGLHISHECHAIQNAVSKFLEK